MRNKRSFVLFATLVLGLSAMSCVSVTEARDRPSAPDGKTESEPDQSLSHSAPTKQPATLSQETQASTPAGTAK